LFGVLKIKVEATEEVTTTRREIERRAWETSTAFFVTGHLPRVAYETSKEKSLFDFHLKNFRENLIATNKPVSSVLRKNRLKYMF